MASRLTAENLAAVNAQDGGGSSASKPGKHVSVARKDLPAGSSSALGTARAKSEVGKNAWCESTVEECIEFIQRPHRSWDSAIKAIAAVEAKKEQLERARSVAGSQFSAASAASAVSNRSAWTVQSSPFVCNPTPVRPRDSPGKFVFAGPPARSTSTGNMHGSIRRSVAAHPHSASALRGAAGGLHGICRGLASAGGNRAKQPGESSEMGLTIGGMALRGRSRPS